LRLTAEGERIEARLNDIGRSWAAAIADGLRPAELERTVDTIREVIRRLETSGGTR
jgi:DNA-binding MarR family transcriptional regulator